MEQPIEYLRGKGLADRQEHLLSTFFSVCFDGKSERYLESRAERENLKRDLLGLTFPQGVIYAEDDKGKLKQEEVIANLIVKELGGQGECEEDGTYFGVGTGVGAWRLDASSFADLQSGETIAHVVFVLAHRYVTGHYTLPGKTVTVMGETMTIGGGTFANTETDRQYYQAVVFWDKNGHVKKVLPLPFHDDFNWHLYPSRYGGFWFAKRGESRDYYGEYHLGYDYHTINLQKGDELFKFDDEGNIILKYSQDVEGEEYYSFEETELYLILAGSTKNHTNTRSKKPTVLFINKKNPNQKFPKFFNVGFTQYDDIICSRVVSMLDEIVMEFIPSNWMARDANEYVIGKISDFVPNNKPIRSETQNKITSDGSELGVILPKFQGEDAKAFATWVSQNLQMPANVPSGTVVVQFGIKPDGTVFDVKVLRGAHPLLDAEAVRVVKSSPKWTPAQLDGKPITYGYHIPIVFSPNLGQE